MGCSFRGSRWRGLCQRASFWTNCRANGQLVRPSSANVVVSAMAAAVPDALDFFRCRLERPSPHSARQRTEVSAELGRNIIPDPEPREWKADLLPAADLSSLCHNSGPTCDVR